MKSNFLKYPLILFLVTVICISAITVANYYVEPILAKRDEENTQKALMQAFDTDSPVEYTEITDDYTYKADTTINNVYEVDDSIVYKQTVPGRNGNIVFLATYSDDMLQNITYIQSHETDGIGSRITEDEFISTVVGQSASTLEVDTLSGATISSTAMKNALEESSDHYESEVSK